MKPPLHVSFIKTTLTTIKTNGYPVLDLFGLGGLELGLVATG